MDRVVFRIGKIEVTIKRVVITLIIVVLLLFAVSRCSDTNIDKKKEETINNVEQLVSNNINDLNSLLKRSDLCSEDWNKDLDFYIERINEQNSLLQKKTDEVSVEVYLLQVTLYHELVSFKSNQNINNIDKLENAYNSYLRLLKGENK